MEKRLIIFVLLSFLILQLATIYRQKTSPSKPKGQTTQTTGTLTAATPEPAQIRQAEPISTPAPRPSAPLPPVETIKFSNQVFEIEFSPRGAVPVRWDIVDPRFVVEDGTTTGGKPREALIDPHLQEIAGGTMPFQLVLRERNAGFHNEVNQEIYANTVTRKDGMTGPRFESNRTASGLKVAKSWLFSDKRFTGQFIVDITNTTSSTLAFDSGLGGLGVVLGPGLGTPDSVKGGVMSWAVVDVVLKSGNQFFYERLSKAGAGQTYDNRLTWGGLQSLYFIGVLIPPDGAPFFGAQAMLNRDLIPTVTSEKKLSLFPNVELYSEPFEIGPGQTRSFTYQFYFGPKQAKVLTQADKDLGRTLDLRRVLFHDSWGWFRPIILFLMWMLDKFFVLTRSYGWSIILLTIFVRVLAFPLVQKGMKEQALMMEQQKKLKPYMDKINEKYKNDPQRKQQEIFKLYKEHNMNPLGMFKGCIWMFIQIPIFVALYKLLSQDIDLRGEPFLWFSDLTQPDQILMFGFTIPWLNWSALNLLPIITAGTQMLASKYTQTTVPTDPQQAEMQKMMVWFMPLFILVLTYGFPSGLMLYWLVSNIWQVLQQLWVNKHIHGPKKKLPPAAAGAKG
ncbi:MAG: membrane protein insertase YidC [Candidatus Sumerlaeia bacterium]